MASFFFLNKWQVFYLKAESHQKGTVHLYKGKDFILIQANYMQNVSQCANMYWLHNVLL